MIVHLTSDEDEQPRNDEGQFVCARRCADGNRCERVVRNPGWPCTHHFGGGTAVTTGDEVARSSR